MKKILFFSSILSVSALFAADSQFSSSVTPNSVKIPDPIKIIGLEDGIIPTGVLCLAGIVAVALAAWAGWLLIKKCLQWIGFSFGGNFKDSFNSIYDFFEENNKRHAWEDAGKPYYLHNEDGTLHRVSSTSYENYLLKNGYSPSTARDYMNEHAYDPDLPPPVVMRDDDDDDF